MNDREYIADEISRILSGRKDYKFIPDGMTEHIVKCIERPGLHRSVYRTGSLIDYLSSRGMAMHLKHEDSGYDRRISSNEDIHEAVRFCIDYYGVSDSKLVDMGVDYRYQRGSGASMLIDKLCEIMDRLSIEMEIRDERG